MEVVDITAAVRIVGSCNLDVMHISTIQSTWAPIVYLSANSTYSRTLLKSISLATMILCAHVLFLLP